MELDLVQNDGPIVGALVSFFLNETAILAEGQVVLEARHFEIRSHRSAIDTHFAYPLRELILQREFGGVLERLAEDWKENKFCVAIKCLLIRLPRI